jgi:hypothetical protein
MKIITKQGVELLIDEDVYEMIKGRTLYLSGHPGNQYFQFRNGGKTVPLHRVIMKAAKGQLVDHINRNTFDNRRVNLRFCTHAQNCANSKTPCRNKYSKFRGVSFHKRDNRWVSICNKKHIGNFDSELEAAIAYDDFIIKEYGGVCGYKF